MHIVPAVPIEGCWIVTLLCIRAKTRAKMEKHFGKSYLETKRDNGSPGVNIIGENPILMLEILKETGIGLPGFGPCVQYNDLRHWQIVVQDSYFEKLEQLETMDYKHRHVKFKNIVWLGKKWWPVNPNNYMF